MPLALILAFSVQVPASLSMKMLTLFVDRLAVVVARFSLGDLLARFEKHPARLDAPLGAYVGASLGKPSAC